MKSLILVISMMAALIVALLLFIGFIAALFENEIFNALASLFGSVTCIGQSLVFRYVADRIDEE